MGTAIPQGVTVLVTTKNKIGAALKRATAPD